EVAAGLRRLMPQALAADGMAALAPLLFQNERSMLRIGRRRRRGQQRQNDPCQNGEPQKKSHIWLVACCVPSPNLLAGKRCAGACATGGAQFGSIRVTDRL